MGLFWSKKTSKEKSIDLSENTKLNELDCNSKKIISKIADAALSNSDINDSINFKYAVRSILNTKVQRVNGNQEMYINSLKTNVLYFINICEDIENLIESWFKFKNIPSSQIYVNEFTSIQQNNKINNINIARNNTFIKKYDSLFPSSKKIESLEWDYMYYNAYSNILIQCMGVIGENKNMVSPLFSQDPSKVVKEIKGYCNLYTNQCIGNLTFVPIISK